MGHMHRKRLVPIAMTIDGLSQSELDLASARRSSFHSSFQRTVPICVFSLKIAIPVRQVT